MFHVEGEKSEDSAKRRRRGKNGWEATARTLTNLSPRRLWWEKICVGLLRFRVLTMSLQKVQFWRSKQLKAGDKWRERGKEGTTSTTTYRTAKVLGRCTAPALSRLENVKAM
jgi:hypothetical protein